MSKPDGYPFIGEPTGLNVIIVGAGLGGLACAIECRRKGHNVTVFENTPEKMRIGDTLGIGPNAGRSICRWGIHPLIAPLSSHAEYFKIFRNDGKPLITQAMSSRPFYDPSSICKNAPGYDMLWGDLHQIFLNTAREYGADIHFESLVVRYFETERSAGVEVGGNEYIADVVIGADGVKSKARELVLGFHDAPRSSGYAIFRAWFDGSDIRRDPVCSHLATEGVDQKNVWIGPDVHFIASAYKKGKEFNWVMTHKDNSNIDENWVYPGDIDDALKVVGGWDPVVVHCIENTPSCLDWKLVYRDPLPTWISKHARIALIGDAAHPFLPTSVQGASQAIEDGVTVATVLKLAGSPADIPTALLTYESIRYEHVCKAQEMGKSILEMWHKTDLYAAEFDPESIRMPPRQWIFENDAEKVAIEKYPEVSKKIKDGSLARQGRVSEIGCTGPSGANVGLWLVRQAATATA